jgi:hypothetical protein
MDINGLLMTLLFTPEELLQYLYKETSPARTAEIEEALQRDWSLREKFEILQNSVHSLPRTFESPRTEVVMNIMNYARETVSEPLQHH